MTGATTIFLVRHAVAIGRSSWKGPDEVRPLTKKGERQAKGLVPLLADAHVGRILSSPAKRCVDTVTPGAAKLHLEIEVADELSEETPPEKAYDLMLEQAQRSDDAVLCAHGDNIIGLLELMRRDGVKFDSRRRWSKGSTWVITVKDGRLHRARYVPPREA